MLRDKYIWGFPQIRGTFWGVLIMRTIVYFGVRIGVPLFRETSFKGQVKEELRTQMDPHLATPSTRNGYGKFPKSKP